MRSTRFICLLSLMLLVAQVSLRAQDTKGWKSSVVGNLNFTQTEFDNWTAGDEDSWSRRGKVQGKSRYIQSKYA